MDFWYLFLLFFLFRRLDNPSLQPKDGDMVLKIYGQLNLQYKCFLSTTMLATRCRSVEYDPEP